MPLSADGTAERDQRGRHVHTSPLGVLNSSKWRKARLLTTNLHSLWLHAAITNLDVKTWSVLLPRVVRSRNQGCRRRINAERSFFSAALCARQLGSASQDVCVSSKAAGNWQKDEIALCLPMQPQHASKWLLWPKMEWSSTWVCERYDGSALLGRPGAMVRQEEKKAKTKQVALVLFAFPVMVW
ncbi:hypothetical protein LZ31DRAFT_146317 [Colletotrichum somersetense]|nr:hypothetical protein LZ31DRAFT_146317 [Colletotrichum somersetense]